MNSIWIVICNEQSAKAFKVDPFGLNFEFKRDLLENSTETNKLFLVYDSAKAKRGKSQISDFSSAEIISRELSRSRQNGDFNFLILVASSSLIKNIVSALDSVTSSTLIGNIPTENHQSSLDEIEKKASEIIEDLYLHPAASLYY